ncbi:MAG: hypothetical protein JWQ68_1152 [Cryobacterium sp.]|nr:hypothetical protein [Cryobacterium sp.]
MSWQWTSIVVVWVLAVVSVVLIAALARPGEGLAWLGLTLAGCTVATLCVQISTRRKDGYVDRMTASIVGAVVVLAAASGVFALVGLA